MLFKLPCIALVMVAISASTGRADAIAAAPLSPTSLVMVDSFAAPAAPIIKVHAAGAISHPAREVPTAPLPPAVWPGLVLLLILGMTRITMNAGKKVARR